MSAITPPVLDNVSDEGIDVLRIRLWNPQNATALLSEFHSADRVLARWAGQPDCNPVGFEVTFIDGHVVQGCHEFFRKGKRKCLFGTHLRRLLQDLPRYRVTH